MEVTCSMKSVIFFIKSGVSTRDISKLRKLCIRMSMLTKSGPDYYLALPLSELAEMVREVNQVVKEQRVRTGNKNRW